MKKLTAFLFTLILAPAIAACGDDDTGASSSTLSTASDASQSGGGASDSAGSGSSTSNTSIRSVNSQARISLLHSAHPQGILTNGSILHNSSFGLPAA